MARRGRGWAATGVAGAIALAGCAAPAQYGSIIVLPGATERLIAAMHYGFHGVGEAKPAASVGRVTSADELVEGTQASGRLGDWVLDNGSVVVVIADVDGSARSGALIDVARGPRRRDGVAAFDTTVLGAPVRYTTIKSGTDEALGSAFVEVSGQAGGLVVSTRYDVAPELDAVLVHTSFTRAAGAPELEGALDVWDRLVVSAADRASCEGSHCATFAADPAGASYVVKPLIDDGAVASVEREGAVVVGLTASTVPAGAYVYSRVVAPLERPDTLALVSALSAADGRQLGELQIELSPERWSKDRAVSTGTFRLTPGRGAPVELALGAGLHAGDVLTVKIPSGAWNVAFESEAYVSTERAQVDVRPGKIASVFVPAERRPTPASRPIDPLPPSESPADATR